MKRIYALLVAVVASFVIAGCISQPVTDEAQAERKAKRLTIVSSGSPSDVLPAFTTYTWSEKHSKVLSSIADHNRPELMSYIQEQLKSVLAQKGYQYRENPKQADVVFGFLFALEDAVADKDIQEKFGLLPGLTADGMQDPRYEKGSLLLAVFDNEQKSTYWRSAVQGFVDIEGDKRDSSNNRMHQLLTMMLDGFPGAGK